MAWDEQTGRALGRAAQFLRTLRTLNVGECIDLPMYEFQDMEFPINPLDRPTWEEKAEWLCQRTGFPCEWRRNVMSNAFVFERTRTVER